jgi:hypothetical protein
MKRFSTAVSFAAMIGCAIFALKGPMSPINVVVTLFAALNALFFMMNFLSCIGTAHVVDDSRSTPEAAQHSEARG